MKKRKQPTKPVAIKSAIVGNVKIVRQASGAIEYHILRPLGMAGLAGWRKENKEAIASAIAGFDREVVVVAGELATVIENDTKQPLFGQFAGFVDPNKVKYDINSLQG